MIEKNLTAREIAEALGGKRSGRGWMARCPSHDDKTPSLRIDESQDGRTLFHCHGGCSQFDVLAVLEELGLWHQSKSHRPPQARGSNIPIETLQELGVNENLEEVAINPFNEKGKLKRQGDLLFEIGYKKSALFHDQYENGFALVGIDDHKECLRLHSKRYKQWLLNFYHHLVGNRCMSTSTTQNAIENLEARAVMRNEQRHVHERVACWRDKLTDAKRIRLFLANDQFESIDIDVSGWRKATHFNVMFERTAGMRALPAPTEGTNILELKKFTNVSDDDFPLLVGWLLYAFHGQGPFPVLSLQGEQGASKSTTAKILRKLIDSNRIELRKAPKSEKDLDAIARNNYIVALDNITSLSENLSDALCTISSTGSGFAARKLYTDADEAISAFCRPICLTAINDIIMRPDLADRAMILRLTPIPINARIEEAIFWEHFEQARPGLLGALLTLLSETLKRLPEIKLTEKPRMADFAVFGAAMERACSWNGKPFFENYISNIEQATENLIENSILTSTLRDFMVDRKIVWEGTMHELLIALQAFDHKVAWSSDWPSNHRLLGKKLTPLIPPLRQIGIDVQRCKSGPRLIRIAYHPRNN